MFPVVLPNGTARQWVSYYFSTMGSAEHPPSEEHAAEEEVQMSRAARMPLWPKGVAVVHTEPNPTFGRQVVLKWDDARAVVIVEAYVDPAFPPDIVREIKLPKVTAANELPRISAQSQLEMGGTYQSFK